MTRNEKSARTTRSVQVPIQLAKMAKIVAEHRDEQIDRVLARHAEPSLTAEYDKVLAELAAEQKKQKKSS